MAIVVAVVAIFVVMRNSERTLQLSDWEAFEEELPAEIRAKYLAMPPVVFKIDKVAEDSAPRNAASGPVSNPMPSSHLINHGEQTPAPPAALALTDDPVNSIVVTDMEFRQAFSAYVVFNHPVFITSDSLLNGYHALLANSMQRLEIARAALAAKAIAQVRKRLPELPPLANATSIAALRIARIVLGVAHQLADSKAPGDADPLVQAAIYDEVARVIAATDTHFPDWWGKPSDTFRRIDYRRYRPTANYNKSAQLGRFFRTLRWLQTIPFHVDRDDHLLALGMIGKAIAAANDESWKTFAGVDAELLGKPTRCEAVTIANLFLDERILNADVSKVRQAFEKLPKSISLNDQASFTKSRFDCRVISAIALPEDILWQRLEDSQLTGGLSRGLVLAAALGSPLARAELASRPEVLVKIDASRDLLRDTTLYCEYLRCVAAVFESPKEAPAFMHSKSWDRKSCQTAAASWTQMRHTFKLETNATWTYLNDSERPVKGLIEPNPEFFLRMQSLIKRTAAILRRSGAFEESTALICSRILDEIRALRFVAKYGRKAFAVLPEERLAFESLARFGLERYMPSSAQHSATRELSETDRELKAMIQILDACESGNLETIAFAKKWLRRYSKSSAGNWQTLDTTCVTLENLARKQLQGKKFDRTDDDFIVSYGDRLADMLGYGSNAGTKPRDDAFRIVDVQRLTDGQYLHAAIGRPRAIFVRYPIWGGVHLCRGAVFPYYEFPASSPLTDSQWQAQHDSADRPQLPAWLRPIYQP